MTTPSSSSDEPRPEASPNDAGTMHSASSPVAPLPSHAAPASEGASPASSTGPWARLRAARVPQLLGVYAGGSFAVVQAADIFMTRLGVPDWAFFGLLLLLMAGVPVVLATALVQEGDASRSAGAAARGGSGGIRRHFTWRNAAWWGAGSTLLLVVLVGGFMGARALGIGPVGSLVAAGVLEREEVILLGDFQSPTGDDVLAGLVTEAFRIDFEQTPLLRVMSPGQVREGLLRMQRSPDVPLTPELARELAVREGVRALLLGEVNTAGRGAIVSVRLVAPDSEESLVALRETAADSSGIIQAVDRLSNRLRERMGESLRTIRSGESLEQVSTASLPALRHYTQAVRAIDRERDLPAGIALLEDAIAADSTFAMAWRKLGVTLRNQEGNSERAVEALTRAYENSDRLSERERLLARGAYHTAVTQDQDRAMAAYRAVLDRYPLDGTALNNLAVILGDRGDLSGAEALYRRALEAHPDQALYYTNLAQNAIRQGDLDAAVELADMLLARYPDLVDGQEYRMLLHVNRHEYRAAEDLVATVLDRGGLTTPQRTLFMGWRSLLALTQGRIADARNGVEDLAAFQRRTETGGQGPVLEQFDSQVAFHLLDRPEVSKRIMEDALAGMGGLPPEAAMEGGHVQVARFHVQFGELDEARELLAEWSRLVEGRPVQEFHRRLHEEVEIRIQAEEGDVEGAIRRLRERLRGPNPLISDHMVLGRYLARLGDAAEAASEMDRFLYRTESWRLEHDAWMRGVALAEAAAQHEAAGNEALALARWEELAALWAEADAPLRPRVEEAERRIVALRTRVGGGG